mmetsp:Transcript_12713/g.22495  ORF Transcript_12713/g.22495 Transcript_12713/m.22495 type:complete len:293 (+) Transcript_12713:118-996(+)
MSSKTCVRPRKDYTELVARMCKNKRCLIKGCSHKGLKTFSSEAALVRHVKNEHPSTFKAWNEDYKKCKREGFPELERPDEQSEQPDQKKILQKLVTSFQTGLCTVKGCKHKEAEKKFGNYAAFAKHFRKNHNGHFNVLCKLPSGFFEESKAGPKEKRELQPDLQPELPRVKLPSQSCQTCSQGSKKRVSPAARPVAYDSDEDLEYCTGLVARWKNQRRVEECLPEHMENEDAKRQKRPKQTSASSMMEAEAATSEDVDPSAHDESRRYTMPPRRGWRKVLNYRPSKRREIDS